MEDDDFCVRVGVAEVFRCWLGWVDVVRFTVVFLPDASLWVIVVRVVPLLLTRDSTVVCTVDLRVAELVVLEVVTVGLRVVVVDVVVGLRVVEVVVVAGLRVVVVVVLLFLFVTPLCVTVALPLPVVCVRS